MVGFLLIIINNPIAKLEEKIILSDNFIKSIVERQSNMVKNTTINLIDNRKSGKSFIIKDILCRLKGNCVQLGSQSPSDWYITQNSIFNY